MLNTLKKIRVRADSLEESEDNTPLSHFIKPKSSNANQPTTDNLKSKDLTITNMITNEPKKPISPYAQYFKDTKKSIKTQNPNVSFSEMNEIVKKRWDELDRNLKRNYEIAYESQMKIYINEYKLYLDMKNAFHNSQDGLNDTYISHHDIDEMEIEEILDEDEQNDPKVDIKIEIKEVENDKQISSSPALSPKKEPEEEEEDKDVKPVCINKGCTNSPVLSNNWDNEYCSAKCLVERCNDAFKEWVANKKAKVDDVDMKKDGDMKSETMEVS